MKLSRQLAVLYTWVKTYLFILPFSLLFYLVVGEGGIAPEVYVVISMNIVFQFITSTATQRVVIANHTYLGYKVIKVMPDDATKKTTEQTSVRS